MLRLIKAWIEGRRAQRAALQWARVRYAFRADMSYWFYVWQLEDRRKGGR